MLNKDFFEQQMRKLAEAFNCEGRHRERYETWFSVLSSRVSDKQLYDAVEEAIVSQDRFPSVKVIIDLCRARQAPITPHISFSSCAQCGGSGIITAIHENQQFPYRYVYACNRCNNCQFQYPIWDGTGRMVTDEVWKIPPAGAPSGESQGGQREQGFDSDTW